MFRIHRFSRALLVVAAAARAGRSLLWSTVVSRGSLGASPYVVELLHCALHPLLQFHLLSDNRSTYGGLNASGRAWANVLPFFVLSQFNHNF